LGVSRIPGVYVPSIEDGEKLLAIEYVKTSVDKKYKFRKIKSMQHVLAALQ